MAALRKGLRLFALLLAAVVATAVTAVLVAWVLLRSGLINDSVDQLVTLLARKEGDFFVRAEDISGDLPYHVRARKVEVGDAEGVWLTIEDVAADWHPLDLFHPRDDVKWRIHADDAYARRLVWTRLPVDSDDDDDEPFRWDRFIRIVADHVRVDDLELTGTLLGGATAHVKAEGSGVLGEWGQGFVLLDVEHIDGVKGKARIDLKTHGSPLELSGTVTAEEEAGGALAAIARIPEAGAVRLEVRASGPMRDWRGEADVTASQIGTLHVKTSLAYTADGPFEAVGTFEPTAAVRERYLLGEGGPVAIAAKGAWAPDVEVRLDDVRLDADARQLSAQGRLDLATLDFHLDARLAHENPAGTVELLPIALATATLKSRGVLGDGGRLEAVLEASEPAVAGVSAGKLHATLAASDVPGDSIPTFELGASAEGLVLPEDEALPLVGDKATLEASGRIDLPAGRIDADKLRLDAVALSVEGPLALREDWGALKTSLRLQSPDLASLEPLFKAAVSGTATATVEASAASGWEDFDVRIRGEAAGVAIEEPGWHALLAGTDTFELNLAGAPRGPAQGDFLLQAPGIQASGKGQVAARGEGLVADARLVLDNLARLSQPARAAISGRLEASAAARGSLDHFDVDASLRGDRFAWEGFHFDSLTADVGAKNLPGDWSADLSARGRHGTLDASLDAGLSMTGERRVAVRGLVLRGPRTEGNADLEVDLESATASGHVRLASEDLAVWRPMTGIALGGAVSIDATLAVSARSSATPVQQVSGVATIRDGAWVIDNQSWSVDVLDASAQGIEIGPSPRGQASVRVTRLRTGTATLVEGSASATGDGRLWNIESKIHAADPPSEAHLDAAATVLPSPSLEVTLTRASGVVDGITVALRDPARWRADRRDPSSWSLDPFTVGVGMGGHLTGEAARAGGKLHIEGEAESVPLSLVTLAAPTLDLGGTIDGKVVLDGATLATAAGEISLRGHDVVTGGLQSPGVEPVSFESSARLARGRIVGSANLTGLTRTRMVLSVDAPLTTATASAPFKADLVWQGEVGETLGLLPIGEDTITGNIDADLHLTGTVAAPRVTGRATLDAATWENAGSGLVMRDIHAELVGSGTSLALQNFTATDGDKGTFAAAGQLRFGELPAFDVKIDMEARGAMLTRLDLITTKGDATLALVASQSAERTDVEGTLTGDVRILDGRVEIPQRFVADVPEIEVIEVSDAMEAAAAGSGVIRRMALAMDVKVTGDNRIFVSGRGVESEWSSDLVVRGDTSDPRFYGKVTSVRGQLSLLGKRFDVDTATLLFDGSKGNVPYLTMTARAEANDITAIAEVTGPATRPVIELRSEPTLPRDEVLSRLLFGQSAATLSPLQSVQLARSVAELTGSPLGGGPGFIGGIGRTLGFDRLDIESSDSDGAAALTASKYLTDKVYLRVQQGLTPEASKLSLEWRVHKHITLESDVSQDAQGEVGATWRWDY